MPIIRNILSSVSNGAIASSDERDLRRSVERSEKTARKANKFNANSSVTAMQSLQAQLSYELVKEQRLARLGDVTGAERCRVLIASLQQQMAVYQPVQQQQHYVVIQQPQPQVGYQPMQQPYPQMSTAVPQSYASYPTMQQQQPPQYAASASSIPAQPVLYSAAPPAYSESSCNTMQ